RSGIDHLFDWRCEHEIAMYDEPHRGARTDGDRRLDLKIAGCELVARARHILLRRFPDRLHKIAFAGEGEARADAEERRDRHALEDRPSVEVDLVGEPGVAGGVGRRHVLDAQRATVREDDALPYDERPLLAERHDAVIGADEARALGD